MKITLIRHTRVAVETGICYGWSDVGVAPSFETEASRVKENISNEQFDIVYSSPLSRRLKELNFGEWEMKKWDDLTDPRLELWYKDWIHLPAGGGESYENQCRRVAQFLDELRHSGHTDACIFTHRGVIACAMVYAGICPVEESFSIEVDYGSKNVLEF